MSYNAPVNLRFDDTNPAAEEQLYVDAIKKDIQWLGFRWDKECYASDYFQTLYDWALDLIKLEKAYVDSQTSEKLQSKKAHQPKQVKTALSYKNSRRKPPSFYRNESGKHKKEVMFAI